MPVKEQVVLVHGLWMHGMVMAWMARRIEHHGYTVHCYSYPTVRLNLAENASRLAAFCDSLGARPLHLVGHSLGGLLIARMLDEPHQLDIGRVVFLGSPYTGSFAARRFSSVPMGRAAVGAAAIFVPFPHAVDDHQTANARYLTDGTAEVRIAVRLDAGVAPGTVNSRLTSQLPFFISLRAFSNARGMVSGR